jgi:RNA polymerase sigma-54 factor
MLHQRQQLRLLQKISPQQIQFIKLLQIPTATLEARIKEEMEVNPALEDSKINLDDDQPTQEEYGDPESSQDSDSQGDEQNDRNDDDDFNISDYLSGDDDFRTRLPSSNDEEDDYETPIVQLKSLYDGLTEQLGMLSLDDRQFTVASHIIGSIDEDGYLRRPIPAMVNDIVFRYNLKTDAQELEELLQRIQRFDPPGIGARDLRECLLLQLERREQTADVKYAHEIIANHFDEFTKKHFKKLKSALGISEEHLAEVYNMITKLNPKPGESQTETKHEIIIPDFALSVENGKIEVKLNGRNAPDLKVSRSYLTMYEEYKNLQKKGKDPKTKEALDFVKNKIESAQWFIDAIKQRQYTLLNTMYAIAEKQQEFFLSEGDEKSLKPMILKDIAEEVEMDISTISRVANSKYVQTDFGIYPLKYFFTEGITTEDGIEVSNREVKRILGELIGAEDKRKPLSDDDLSEQLQQKGYHIARRTVAKYREQLGLPVARLRKEI